VNTDQVVVENMRRAVEALATGRGPIRERLQTAEPHFGRAFERGAWPNPAEQRLRLRIGAGLAEGQGGAEDDGLSVGESIAVLDEAHAAQIAADMLLLYEIVVGLREDDGWPSAR
jgi:hypothetical protein